MEGTWLDTGAGCSMEVGKACRIERCEDSICGGEDRVAYCVNCEVLAEYYRRECEIARTCEWNDGYVGGAPLCRFVKH